MPDLCAFFERSRIMKKQLLSILLASVFLMSSCTMASEETTAETGTAETTTAETSAETTTVETTQSEKRTEFSVSEHMVVYILKERLQMWQLYPIHGEVLCEILNRGVWEVYEGEVETDYVFTANGLYLAFLDVSGEIYDEKNRRKMTLSDADRAEMTEIFGSYGAKKLTLLDVEDWRKYSKHTWNWLRTYENSGDIGSGLYILKFDINSELFLLVGGSGPLDDAEPDYIRLVWKQDETVWVDIRDKAVYDAFWKKLPVKVFDDINIGIDSIFYFRTVLSREDTVMLCEIVNRTAWTEIEDFDDFDYYYMDFSPISMLYYPKNKCFCDHARNRALVLSDEDAERVNQMIARYHSKQMTLDDVRAFVAKGSITWGDLAIYDGVNRGTSVPGAIFTIDENYTFVAYGTADFRSEGSLFGRLSSEKDGVYIDLFEQDLEKFLTGDFSDTREITYVVSGEAYLIDPQRGSRIGELTIEQAETICRIASGATWSVGKRNGGTDAEFECRVGNCYFQLDVDTRNFIDAKNNRTTVLSAEDMLLLISIFEP